MVKRAITSSDPAASVIDEGVDGQVASGVTIAPEDEGAVSERKQAGGTDDGEAVDGQVTSGVAIAPQDEGAVGERKRVGRPDDGHTTNGSTIVLEDAATVGECEFRNYSSTP